MLIPTALKTSETLIPTALKTSEMVIPTAFKTSEAALSDCKQLLSGIESLKI